MGIIISLSGVDNAGKSTQAKLIADYYRKKGKKVKITEFAFGYYLLKPLIKTLRKKTGNSDGGPVKRNLKQYVKAWFILALFDIWIGYVFHLRPVKKKFDVVIADRFYTDIWVNLLYYGYLPRWAFEFFLRFLPKPDVAFVLLIRPQTGFGRIRDEFPKTYYLEQVKLYKELSKKIDCHAIHVKKEPKIVFKKIVRLI